MKLPWLLTILFVLISQNLASAQQRKKLFRIGYLSVLDAARESTRSEALRLALRELGYIEGQNIAVEYRFGEGKNNRLPALAGELVRLMVPAPMATRYEKEVAAFADKNRLPWTL